MSPLATERLNRRSSKAQIEKAISACIETELSSYHETGKIGASSPGSEEEARAQASAVCYHSARSHAGATKVPKR